MDSKKPFRIVYNWKDFKKAIEEAPKGSSIVFQEIEVVKIRKRKK